MAVYVYAIVRKPIRLRKRSGDPGALRSITGSGIAAIVSDRSIPPTPTERALRRHDAAVRRIARAAPAVLPVRFGTLLPSDRAVQDALKAAAVAFRKSLTLVHGREQMTLRLFGRAVPERAAARDRLEPESEQQPGTRYLTRLARASARARSAPELEPLRKLLAPMVAAERIARHDSGPLLLTAYHLIPRGAAQDYRSVLNRHASALGLRAAASGPWPPYAFAPELDL